MPAGADDLVSPGSPGRARVWTLWLTWVAFVVYGSLVPLDFRPHSLHDAWIQLVNAPLLQVGMQGRADWIANGVLYLPVGFLTTAVLLGARRDGHLRTLAATVTALVFSGALAVAVEYTQVFFPPRTVSLNDIVAEVLGSLLGVLAALGGALRFRALLTVLDVGGAKLLRMLAPAYAIGFVALALFPYDLLISADEWAQKLQGSNVALLLAGRSDLSGAVSQLAKLVVEILSVVPIGAWWASRRSAPPTMHAAAWPEALLRGALLGLAIEIAQLAIASGVSQGVSVLTRAIGFAAGAAVWQRRDTVHIEDVRAWLRRATLPALGLYLPLVTLQFGWWRSHWMGLAQAWLRLQADVRFLPFYYHYYTTEMHALVSVLAVVSSYAPVGLAGWAWHADPLISGVMAAILALAIEAGRLMVVEAKPDPTNILIAGAAAWAVHGLLQRLTKRRPMARSGA